MSSPNIEEKNDNSVTSLKVTCVDDPDEARGVSSNDVAATAKPKNSILYSNAEDTTLIIDIPGSIMSAQSSLNLQDSRRQILSCPAPVTPYPSTEPKTEKARTKLLDRLEHSAKHIELHAAYSRLIVDAVAHLKEQYVLGPNDVPTFLLPRVVKAEEKTQDDVGKNAKRKFKENVLPKYVADAAPELELLQNHTKSWSRDIQKGSTLPPLSTVLLGLVDTSISTLSTFHTACLAHCSATNGRFPLIVLDPPWPNKSVSRSSSYITSPTLVDLVDTLQGLGLEEHIADQGFVACWVTNKATIRDAVIGEGGLFEAWGVELVEEWIWCKVTTKGEPVTDVNGIWRRPYEVCLIGKRNGNVDKQTKAKRGVIFGVPDLHSRKPCLKELAGKLLLHNKDGKESDCAALELFARYAVAGWMSWGLEATKYNHEEWWIEEAASLGTAG